MTDLEPTNADLIAALGLDATRVRNAGEQPTGRSVSINSWEDNNG